MNTYKFFCACLGMSLVGEVVAQHSYSSQFISSPLNINPALTGMIKDQKRATLNYYSQWTTLSNPFTTVSASVDMTFLKDKLKLDWLGAGLLLMDHRAGSGFLTYKKLMLSVAFFKWVNNHNYISAGLQTGMVQYKKDTSKLLRQYINNGIPSYINNEKTNKFFKLDIQTGLLWAYIPNEYFSVYSGIGLFHFLKSSNQFPDPDYTGPADLEREDRIGKKAIIHSNAKIDVNRQINIYPSILYMIHKQKQEMMIGGLLGITFGKNYSTRATWLIGSWYQFDDAVTNKDFVVFNTGLQYHKWMFNIKYFVKTSFFKQTVINLLHPEFSLIYIIPAPPGPGEWPKDYPSFF